MVFHGVFESQRRIKKATNAQPLKRIESVLWLLHLRQASKVSPPHDHKNCCLPQPHNSVLFTLTGKYFSRTRTSWCEMWTSPLWSELCIMKFVRRLAESSNLGTARLPLLPPDWKCASSANGTPHSVHVHYLPLSSSSMQRVTIGEYSFAKSPSASWHLSTRVVPLVRQITELEVVQF